MNKSTQIIIGIIIIIIVAGGIVSSGILKKQSTAKADEAAMMKKDEDAKMKKDEEAAMMKKEEDAKMAKTDPAMKKDGEVMTKIEGSYVDYKPELLANADKAPVVLFFHANWCPTCKALDKDINDRADALKKSGVTLLKIDYDTANDLKKQYGITVQSSFVKIDSTGKQLKKASSIVTVDSLSSFANS
jgi:thiol-disulfide isomerase/thioredoxin